MLYPALIHQDEPGGSLGASFPDLPGCITAADDMAELYEAALEALQLHVDGLIEDGLDVPLPTHGLVADPDAIGLLFVPVRLPGKAKRVNISLDEFLLKDIDRAAQARGSSRSAFLAEGARLLLKTG